jgi:ubiquinone/menaquinone biosynthesis C-methylase UbiE
MSPFRHRPTPLGAPPDETRASARREARYFDDLVQRAGDFDPFADQAWATLARRFAAVAPAATGRLLDVGCGTGQSRQVYGAHAGSYHGLDLSFGTLAVAGRRLPGRWVQGNANHLPWPDASCDVVAFSSVLHHLPERGPALAEARRVLRPGGLVFAFDPNLLHPAMALFRHPRSPLYRTEGVSPDERPLLPRTLRRDLQRAGFDPVGQRCQSDIRYRSVAPKGFGSLLPIYNWLDSAWERVGLGRWLGTFVVTWGWRP